MTGEQRERRSRVCLMLSELHFGLLSIISAAFLFKLGQINKRNSSALENHYLVHQLACLCKIVPVFQASCTALQYG